MPFIEVCTTVMGNQTCVEDSAFIAALLVELSIYLLVFVIGHRTILWVKKQKNE